LSDEVFGWSEDAGRVGVGEEVLILRQALRLAQIEVDLGWVGIGDINVMVTGALAEYNMLCLLRLSIAIGAGPVNEASRHQREHTHQQQGGETAQEGWEQVERAHSGQRFAGRSL
jgi:hypothetical protein